MVKKYPMTYEEFKEKVMELLFEGMDPVEKKETEKELKDLLEGEPDMFKHLYSSTCGAYDRDKEYPEHILKMHYYFLGLFKQYYYHYNVRM